MAEKKEEGEGKAEEAKPKSKKKLFIIIGVVVLLLGGGAFFMLKKSASKDAESKVEETEKPHVFVKMKMEPFIVNLSEAKSFLKTTIILEYDADLLAKASAGSAEGKAHGGGGGGEGEKGGEGGGGPPPQFTEKEAVIRDKIIAILSSKTPTDVLSSTGKETLKDEILEAVNEILDLPEPIFVAIYFAEFMIQ